MKCKKHKSYQAKRPPRVKCLDCQHMYKQKMALKVLDLLKDGDHLEVDDVALKIGGAKKVAIVEIHPLVKEVLWRMIVDGSVQADSKWKIHL